AAGDALRGSDQVRHDILVRAGEPIAGAAGPGLDLVGNEHDAVFRAPRRELRQEPGRRHDEPAFTLDRLDDDRGNVGLADPRVRVVGGDAQGPGGTTPRTPPTARTSL